MLLDSLVKWFKKIDQAVGILFRDYQANSVLEAIQIRGGFLHLL
jgi:hypothetical protein